MSRNIKKYMLAKSYATWRNVGIGLILLLLLVRIFVIINTVKYNTNTSAANLKAQVNEDVNQIRYQFNDYTSLLYAGRALFSVNNSVSRQDWLNFFDNQLLNVRYPGLYAIAYISVINHTQISSFTSQLNQNRLPNETNQLSIFPNTNGQQLAILTYLAPKSVPQNIIGYNLFSSQTRKAILLSAASSGLESVSDPLSLKGLMPSKTPNGVLIVLPNYNSTNQSLTTTADRQAALEGYIILAARLQTLFNPIFSSSDNRTLNVTITNNNIVIYHHGNKINKPSLQQNVEIQLANQNWLIRVSAPTNYSLSATAILAPNTIIFTLVPLLILLILTLYFALKYHETQYQKD